MRDKSLSSIFDDEKVEKNTESTAIDIAALVFKAQLDAHITHLEQRDKTLPRHNAMSIFYEEIDDVIDTFVETFYGINGVSPICTQGSCCIENPPKYFKDLYNKIDMLRKPIKESFLQNQIDEIQQLIAHTLYRLNNITT